MTVQQQEENMVKPETSFNPLKSHVHAMIVSGDRLCVAGKDTTLTISNFDGEESISMEGHSYDINALSQIDGTLFSGADAKGSPRNFLKAWDGSSGTFLHNLEGHTSAVWALAAGAGLLFSGDDSGIIRVWADAGTPQCTCVRTLEGHTGRVRSLFFCVEEDRLYSGGNDGKVLVWDPQTGEQVRSLAGQGWITALQVDGGNVYAASTDKTVIVFNKESGDRITILTHDNWVSSLACYDGTLFTGVGDATVCVWDVASTTLKGKVNGHMEFHAVSALSVHGDTLFSAGWDGAVAKWDIPTMLEALAKQQTVEVVDVTADAKVEQVTVASSGNIFDEGDIVELLD